MKEREESEESKPSKRSWIKTSLLLITTPLSMAVCGVVGTLGGIVTGAIAGGIAGYIQGSTSKRDAEPVLKHEKKIISAIKRATNLSRENKDWIDTILNHVRKAKKHIAKGVLYGAFGALGGAITGAAAGLISGISIGAYATVSNSGQKGKGYVATLIETFGTLKKSIVKKLGAVKEKILSPGRKPIKQTIMSIFFTKALFWTVNTALPVALRITSRNEPPKTKMEEDTLSLSSRTPSPYTMQTSTHYDSTPSSSRGSPSPYSPSPLMRSHPASPANFEASLIAPPPSTPSHVKPIAYKKPHSIG